MFCSNCGKEININNGVNFCSFCGSKINEKEAVSVSDDALISQVQNARRIIGQFFEYLYLAKDMELNSYCYQRAFWHLSAFRLLFGSVKTVLYIMSAVIGGFIIVLSFSLLQYFPEVNLEKYNILCYVAILLSILVVVLPNAVIIHKGKKYKKNEHEIKKWLKIMLRNMEKKLDFFLWNIGYRKPLIILHICWKKAG